MDNMSYINKYSWKCLLGKQSKNIREENEIYFWTVGKKNHFCTDKVLTENDIPNLLGHSFHYLSIANKEFLNNHCEMEWQKQLSTTIDLNKFDLSGGKYKKVRQSINKNKNKYTVEDNYRDIKDVKDLIEEWSNILAQKYFRDNSGKNHHFYSNNWHKDCINVFVYEGNKLIGFSTASNTQPSVYIIGKALCNQHSGLSEYIDYELYQKLLKNNINFIDLGQTSGKLVFYKNKFPGAETYNYYNGKVLAFKNTKKDNVL